MPVGISPVVVGGCTEPLSAIQRIAPPRRHAGLMTNSLIQSARVKIMNKGELIDSVAGAAGLSRADATKAVDAVLDSIQGTLSNGGSVSLVGFGTFSVKARAARAGRNPRTGETIQIKASNVPGFKAGKGLKDAVN